MIVSALIFIIALLSIKQDSKRRLTALIFTLLTLSHELFFQGLPGYYYFMSAALIDLLIVETISRLKYTTKLTENLMRLCVCFIILNAVAWIMWEYSINYEFVYESISAFLYFCVIVSLLNWDGVEDGNYNLNSWTDPFHINNLASHFRYKDIPKAARN